MSGDAPDIVVPGPSAAETALMQEQTAILRQQRDSLSEQLRVQALLSPFLYSSAGLEPITSGGLTADQQSSLTALQAERSSIAALAGTAITGARRATIGHQEHDTWIPASPAVAGTSPEETARINAAKARLSQIDTEISRLNAIQSNAGTISGFRRVDDPLQAKRKEIESLLLGRTEAALKGELPENPALLRELETGEMTLREKLRRELGPGFETSTPGQESLDRFFRSKSDILESSRRGDLTLAESLGLAREGANEARIDSFLKRSLGVAGANESAIGGLGNVASGFNAPLSQLFNQRQLETNASIQRASLASQQQSGWSDIVGQLLGNVVGAATYKWLDF